MKKVEIKGIIPPIVTPMNEDESVNEKELRNQVNRQIKGGIHGLFPFGTNGEGYILNEKEKEEVLSIVIDETKGRVPVYAGTGCISTKDTIRQSQMAESLEPMYFPSSPRPLPRHPRMSCTTTIRQWRRQWICQLFYITFRPEQATPLLRQPLQN